MRWRVVAERRLGPDFELRVELDLRARVLGLVGESGAGKSCLLDVLAGVAPGTVRLDDDDLSDLPPCRRRVGWVTQDPLLFPHLDVAANLRFSPHAGDFDEVIDALDIGALLARRPASLSGGERRRVSLARALVSRPRLLLLDEPFAGLDERRRRRAMALLLRVHGRFDLPMLLVSHSPEEVIGLADHAVRLHQGKLVAQGRPTELLRVGETGVDNHLLGEVCGPDAVRVDEQRWRLMLPPGTVGKVELALFAHDVLLARGDPGPLSARNRWSTRVVSLEPAGGAVLVRLEQPGLLVSLTQAAVSELELVPGVEVTALVKASSIACLGSA